LRGAAAAERVIEANETTTLSAADWEAFYDALVDLPEPNERLRRAIRRHRETTGG
jgi:uncharacterized protein (DUF1778 family)